MLIKLNNFNKVLFILIIFIKTFIYHFWEIENYIKNIINFFNIKLNII
jgi:hypothetical protein